MKISDLERGACLRILFLLKDGASMSGREIGEFVNYHTFQLTREILTRLELIQVDDDPDSRRLIHQLTAKGLKVAKHVDEIEKLI